jgi:hypothetical protein
MPLTATALSKVDKWLGSVDDAHSTLSVTKRSLNLATFGLVTGVGVGAATGASASGLRDAALAAGVAVAGSSLFAPDEQLRLYTTASKALVCVRSRATTLRGTVDARLSQLAANSSRQFVSQTFTPVPCALDSETAAALGRYTDAHNRATTAIQQAALSDPSIAAKIENAGQNVVVALNEQLDLLVPSTEAILNSARSAGSIATALYSPPVAAATPQAAGTATCFANNSESLESVRNRLAAMTLSALAMESAVAEQINAVAALDTACTLAPLQISPVTLNNTEVAIAKDSKMHIAISGGWGQYSASPLGVPPPPELSVDIIGSTLILTAKSTLTAGATYVILVKDSSALPRPAQLKITTK